MTEDEAKTKWCPMFQRTMTNNRGGSNNNRKSGNDQTFSGDCTCVASDCVLWVETDRESVQKQPKGDNIYAADFKPAGHCGLIK